MQVSRFGTEARARLERDERDTPVEVDANAPRLEAAHQQRSRLVDVHWRVPLLYGKASAVRCAGSRRKPRRAAPEGGVRKPRCDGAETRQTGDLVAVLVERTLPRGGAPLSIIATLIGRTSPSRSRSGDDLFRRS